ncbi:MAG TPA: phosphatase PAP2 family protein [Mycobacterium sp.]|nr:phosphatase PAP2 family protein [Mycobacterium sp.]HPX38548.1 phosphatase PAP2 family protein [Mycobacterium sp.]HPZ96070.1 phosphatase PAP2 family protein [Mycobacterium sp.]HQC77645.1 phosphatase PAP2 family protein [Mycobacterium sp.]HQE14780.1 phosphatase PAP2 family protein [Mycobacterium sp.]
MERDVGVGAAGLGPVGVGVLAVLVVVSVLAVWVARHPQLGGRLERVGEIPMIGPVLRLCGRCLEVLVAPVQARLGLRGVAVATLGAGLVVVGAAAVGFTDLLDDVLDGEGFAAFDEPVAAWLAAHREVWLTRVLLVATRMGEVDAQTVWLTLVCVLAAVRARSWLPVLVGVAGGGGVGLVIVIAKHLVGRPRPGLPYALIPAPGFSFPSGHATGAAAVGILGAWMLCRWVIRRWAIQVAVWAATVTAIVLIGFSRPYLGVHFLTDVLAGWLLGAGWAVTVVLAVSWWSRARPVPQEAVASPGGMR